MSLPIRYRTPDGVPLISVTQVLTLAGRIDDRWFTEESRWRGSTVHALTEAFDRGDALDIPPILVPYLDAYAEFVAIVRPVYLATELAVLKVFDDPDDDEDDNRARTGGLAGRIDRVCDDLLGTPGIVDFKTGAAEPWHGLQLAAYNGLRPTGARWACYLQPNGRYKLKQYDDPADHWKFEFDFNRTRRLVQPVGETWVDAA